MRHHKSEAQVAEVGSLPRSLNTIDQSDTAFELQMTRSSRVAAPATKAGREVQAGCHECSLIFSAYWKRKQCLHLLIVDKSICHFGVAGHVVLLADVCNIHDIVNLIMNIATRTRTSTVDAFHYEATALYFSTS